MNADRNNVNSDANTDYTANDYHYMDVDENHVTYIPVKIKTSGSGFYEGDIVMKRVRYEESAPPVYYAYKCVPLEFPMTLKGTQYEIARNVPVLQNVKPKKMYSPKFIDEYEPAAESAVPKAQQTTLSGGLPQRAQDKSFASTAPTRPVYASNRSSNSNVGMRNNVI